MHAYVRGCSFTSQSVYALNTYYYISCRSKDITILLFDVKCNILKVFVRVRDFPTVEAKWLLFYEPKQLDPLGDKLGLRL